MILGRLYARSVTSDQNASRKPSPGLVTLFCIMVATVALYSLYSVLPYREPWTWLLLGVVVLSAAAFLVSLARFVLAQREDYWLERGRDPKNPKAPSTNDPGA